MPGFNRTGPMGMGPMTGGGRGLCGPGSGRRGMAPNYGGGRRGQRGFRHMYWAAGIPGWGRPPAAVPWSLPNAYPNRTEDETAALRGQAAALKDQLRAVENRLERIASGASRTDESAE